MEIVVRLADSLAITPSGIMCFRCYLNDTFNHNAIVGVNGCWVFYQTQSINWALLELYDELCESQGPERKESGWQKQQILHQGVSNLQFCDTSII